MKKEYFEQVDVLRGFAILLVVLGHAVAPSNVASDSISWCNNIYTFIYTFHMALFFAISGFCFTNRESYFSLVAKKARFLLIPYVVFNLITVVLRRILPMFSLLDKSLGQSLWDIVFYGGEIWFLYVLFEIFVLAPLLLKVTRGTWARTLAVEVLLLILFFFVKDQYFLRLSDLVYFMMFFLLGNALRQHRDNPLHRMSEWTFEKKLIAFVGILIVDVAVLVVFQRFTALAVASPVFDLLLALLGCTLSFLLIDLIGWKPWKTVLKAFGNYSLQIYLFNGYFIAVARTIFLSILGMPIWIVVIANLVFGLVFNDIWCYVILKLKFVRFLCGKR